MKINKISLLGSAFASLIMLHSTTVYSEAYIAADLSYIDGRAVFDNGRTPFDLTTGRIRFGQRFESFGWELHALGTADGTGNFSGSGGLRQFDLRGGFGFLGTTASIDRRWYGGIGFTQIYTKYSWLDVGSPIPSVSSDTLFFTFTFGGQYPVSKNAKISLDYTLYLGDMKCPLCTPPAPGSGIADDPEVQLHSLNLGFNYSF